LSLRRANAGHILQEVGSLPIFAAQAKRSLTISTAICTRPCPDLTVVWAQLSRPWKGGTEAGTLPRLPHTYRVNRLGKPGNSFVLARAPSGLITGESCRIWTKDRSV